MKTHGSVGSMPGPSAKASTGAKMDHCSTGKMPSGSGAYDPTCPANGKPGNFEGGKGKCVTTPKEKDYSRNGL
jgi:hypothetical protein